MAENDDEVKELERAILWATLALGLLVLGAIALSVYQANQKAKKDNAAPPRVVSANGVSPAPRVAPPTSAQEAETAS